MFRILYPIHPRIDTRRGARNRLAQVCDELDIQPTKQRLREEVILDDDDVFELIAVDTRVRRRTVYSFELHIEDSAMSSFLDPEDRKRALVRFVSRNLGVAFFDFPAVETPLTAFM